MSYVLQVWEGAEPRDLEEADKILGRLLEDPTRRHRPRLAALAKALWNQFPKDIETAPDDPIWSDGARRLAQGLEGLLGGAAGMSGNLLGASFRIGDQIQAQFLGGTTIPLPANSDFLKYVDDPAHTIADDANYLAMAVVKYNPVTMGVEGICQIGQDYLAGDYKAMFGDGIRTVVMLAAAEEGVSEPTKRAIGFEVKQMSFLAERIKSGAVDRLRLDDFERELTDPVREYAIRDPEKAAAGSGDGSGGSDELPAPTDPAPPVETINGYADRNIGTALDLGTDPTTGEPMVEKLRDDFCFAAGTLVHTANGLVAIEKIRVGDLVLSQPEAGGEKAYKRVLNTVVHQDKHVILVSYVVQDEMEAHHLVVTGNHPFWVKDKGWLRADRMTQGEFVQLQDGREAYVYLARGLFKTEREGFGWTCHPGFERGTEVDFRNGRIEVLAERNSNGDDSGAWGIVTQNVYNLEVEEFHTYYVGEAGVWVHNTNCASPSGGTVASRQLELNSAEERAAGLSPDPNAPIFALQIELKVKQMSFLAERIKSGVVDRLSLDDFERELTDPVREYAIRDPEKAAAGSGDGSGGSDELPAPTDPAPPVETINGYADRNIGTALDLGTDPTTGEPMVEKLRDDFCFAAGTLVHTANGLVAIEKIQVGDLVLSQPETGGELAYKRVLNTVVHQDKHVILVSYLVDGEDESRHLAVTGNHPFWVKGKGWLRADRMSSGAFVQLQDGREAYVHLAEPLYKTNREGFGWTCHPGSEEGTEVDFRSGRMQMVSERSLNGEDSGGWGFVTQNIYNFEVEEFHTYYVGELGVWVHNTNCGSPKGTMASMNMQLNNEDQSTAAGGAAAQGLAIGTEIEAAIVENDACFTGDTPVMMEGGVQREIEMIYPGDKVLSRCEETGQIACREVIRRFVDIKETYYVTFVDDGAAHEPPLEATPGHPFWVLDKGWTEVKNLQLGDVIKTYDGRDVIVDGVMPTMDEANVYNLEVSEFHTYFVGKRGLWVHNASAIEFMRIDFPSGELATEGRLI